MNKLLLSITVLLLLVGCRQDWERDVKTDIIVSYNKDTVSFKNKNFDSVTLIGIIPYTDFRSKKDTVKFNKTCLVDSSYIAISFEEEYERVYFGWSRPSIYIDTIKAIRNDTTYYYLRHKNYLINKEDDYYSTSYLTQNQKIVEAKILTEKLLYRDRIIITVSMVLTLIFALVAYKREEARKIRRAEEIEEEEKRAMEEIEKLKERKKELEEDKAIILKSLKEDIEKAKTIYKETNEPLMGTRSYIEYTQQKSTGALKHFIPKEPTLISIPINGSPKVVVAVGVNVVYLDAFGDVINSVSLSSKCNIEPYHEGRIEERIYLPLHFVDYKVVINKVKFLDGTIWQR